MQTCYCLSGRCGLSRSVSLGRHIRPSCFSASTGRPTLPLIQHPLGGLGTPQVKLGAQVQDSPGPGLRAQSVRHCPVRSPSPLGGPPGSERVHAPGNGTPGLSRALHRGSLPGCRQDKWACGTHLGSFNAGGRTPEQAQQGLRCGITPSALVGAARSQKACVSFGASNFTTSGYRATGRSPDIADLGSEG
ncbi:hypothetical protein NDU88_003110 [Pleurodeles waltl]|uniref:Uncharacterized protein n=1 Tax=Pleurodeles waltl TaxID=8319 RepID=A0AAV7NIZ0_PLEWA|nr:hypothetical protein NDU88_003110 [Pleurodeles waltl]